MNKERKKDESKEMRESFKQLKKYAQMIKENPETRDAAKKLQEQANTCHFWGFEYSYDKESDNIKRYSIQIKPHLDETKKYIMLSEDRVSLLYDLLQKGGFVGGLYLSEYQRGKYGNKVSAKDMFIWAFNYGEEPYIIAPIIWNMKKNSLRELFEFFIKPITKDNIESIKQIFCDKNGKPVELNKRKKGEYSKYYTDLQTLTNQILER